MKTSLQCLLLKIESAVCSENPIDQCSHIPYRVTNAPNRSHHQTDPCQDCQLVDFDHAGQGLGKFVETPDINN